MSGYNSTAYYSNGSSSHSHSSHHLLSHSHYGENYVPEIRDQQQESAFTHGQGGYYNQLRYCTDSVTDMAAAPAEGETQGWLAYEQASQIYTDQPEYAAMYTTAHPGDEENSLSYGSVSSSTNSARIFSSSPHSIRYPWDVTTTYQTTEPMSSPSYAALIENPEFDLLVGDLEGSSISETMQDAYASGTSSSHSPYGHGHASSSPDAYHLDNLEHSPLSYQKYGADMATTTTPPGIHSYPYRCPMYLLDPEHHPNCEEVTLNYPCRIKNHIAKHTSPYECSKCFKRFSTRFSLERHRDPERVMGCGSQSSGGGQSITERERAMHEELKTADTVERIMEVVRRYYGR